LLTKAAGLGDIRAIGSGNIGATNVLRTGNKGLAGATLLLDALKGTLAVLIAADLALGWMAFESGGTAIVSPNVFVSVTLLAKIAAAYGAFLGHCYPVWLGFRGGKGVATYIGILLGIFWPMAIAFCAVWLVIALVSRFSSLAALVAAALAPVAAAVLGRADIAILVIPLSLLLIFKHHTNIRRLLAGEEPRIGQKA